ncbi:HotDog domain-containing protein [Daedaleopsis nitida]|nr:HotDog domain-containing protein [Daedaleopsis nitida]
MAIFKGLPAEMQDTFMDTLRFFQDGPTFAARAVGSRLELEKVEVSEREKDGRMQARVVFTIVVNEEMLNIANTMHGGCAAYLIDMCSSIAMNVLAQATDKPPFYVSQALNTTFHAPAPLGATLEIVSITTALGTRTASGVTEIWDTTHRRLCVTGVHNKMAPSKSKL